jgi:hypothetical protein
VGCAACGFVTFPNMGIGAAVVVRDAEARAHGEKRSAHQFNAGSGASVRLRGWGGDIRAARLKRGKPASTW